MAYTDAGKAMMLGALRNGITHISLHDGDPGDNGANEIDGTGNDYERAAVTSADFSGISEGEFTLDEPIEFDGPANGPCTHAGIWDGATFLGGAPITGDQQFNAEGKYLLQDTTSFNLNA